MEKKGKEQKLTQEEQYIFRFPPPLAEKMRMMLKSGQIDNVSLVMGGANLGPREGRFCIEENGVVKQYKVTLADLPCIVETQKTLNCKDFYKSGDIGQIFLVEDLITTWPINQEGYAMEGLTPYSKNIRKRLRQKDIVQEAQKAVLGLQKGAKGNQFDLEEISFDEIDAVYVTPKGNTIVTRKNGLPPLRAGNPNTFTDDELDLLPQQHKEAALKEEEQKEAEFTKILDKELEQFDVDVEDESEEEPVPKRRRTGTLREDEEEEDEEEDEVPEEAKKAVSALAISQMSDEELPPEIETQIRSWRIEKVDIANEIGKLQKQKQGVNAQLKANMPPRLKLVLEGRIEQYNATIESKREQMAELDKKLSQYNRL